MIDQPYILLIMNCKKYRSKALQQKETWLKNLPSNLLYFHVIGDTELEEEYKFDNEDHILYVNVEDDYNSLPKKVIHAYEAVYNEYKFKYIFKTDDDQDVISMNIFTILPQILESSSQFNVYHYGGNIVDVKQSYLSQYHKIHPELPKDLPVRATKYCNGRFYFLSRSAAKYLLTKKDKISEEYLEDYAIGYYLPQHIFKEHMLSLQTDKYFKDMIMDTLMS
jgi:hypothetical protein